MAAPTNIVRIIAVVVLLELAGTASAPINRGVVGWADRRWSLRHVDQAVKIGDFRQAILKK